MNESSLKIAATGISSDARKKLTSDEMHKRNKEFCRSTGKAFYWYENCSIPMSLFVK